jgi:methylglutaconyl-CoA hydratase
MVNIEISDRVAYIAINRPEKRNALNREVVAELTVAFEKAIADEKVRVIQLSGNGAVFCAGADLAAIQAMRQFTDAENREDTEALRRLFDTIYNAPKPVIAAVKGAALAGGCGLATVCDVIIAEEQASFGYTETRLGFVPALVSVYLVRKIGEAQVRRLLLGAEIIKAPEAKAIGLITEAVPAEEFENRLAYWREVFTTRVSGEAVKATKKLVSNAYAMPESAAFEGAVDANVRVRKSADCRLGIDRFLAGEKNTW